MCRDESRTVGFLGNGEHKVNAPLAASCRMNQAFQYSLTLRHSRTPLWKKHLASIFCTMRKANSARQQLYAYWAGIYGIDMSK